MTGVSPAGLLSGGPLVFDALIERAKARRTVGYEQTELLATLVEVSHALLRVTLKAYGGKAPDAIEVKRPKARIEQKAQRLTPRELAERMKGGEVLWQPR